MMRSLATAKTGLEAQQTQLDAITHNLANGSTNGYKRAHVVFEDLMYQNIRQAGAPDTQQTQLPTGLQLGTGVRAVATARNFSQGAINPTGNPLDLAINGAGFFQVQMPDGSMGYTRDGAFQVDAQGQMVNSNGLPLSPAITIPATATGVTIGRDGLVTAQMPGATAPQQIGHIQLAYFTNPAGLDPRGANVFTETAASGNPQTGNPGTPGLGVIQQAAVEGSNVNIVEELVAMIQTQRAYEVNSKAIQTSDQMLARLAQL